MIREHLPAWSGRIVTVRIGSATTAQGEYVGHEILPGWSAGRPFSCQSGRVCVDLGLEIVCGWLVDDEFGEAWAI